MTRSNHNFRTAHRGAQSGAVLLLVLAVLVIVMALSMTWISTSVTVHREFIAQRSTRLQVELLQSGEQIARAWIKRHAATAVSPENGGGWTVADDLMSFDDDRVRIQVTIFDGWSALPLPLIHVQGALRRELPPTLSYMLITPTPALNEEQLLRANDSIEHFSLPLGVRRFPDAGWHAGDPVQWCSVNEKSLSSEPRPPASTPADVIALVINPHSDGRINLNTAPFPLIRRVCQLRGVGLPEHLLKNRRHGIHTTAPSALSDGNPDLPRLVDFTLVWNCLITVKAHNQAQSWWVVLGGNPDNLRILQRHDADQ
jgi:hypothetical protein